MKSKAPTKQGQKRQATIYEHFRQPGTKKSKSNRKPLTVVARSVMSTEDDPFGLIEEDGEDETQEDVDFSQREEFLEEHLEILPAAGN